MILTCREKDIIPEENLLKRRKTKSRQISVKTLWSVQMFYGWSNKYINMVLHNRENRNSDISHDVWGLCTDSFPAIDLRRIHGCFVTAYSFIVTQKPDQQGFPLTTKEAWSPFYAPWTVTNEYTNIHKRWFSLLWLNDVCKYKEKLRLCFTEWTFSIFCPWRMIV